jgi:transposase
MARSGPRKLQRYGAAFKLKAVKLSSLEGVRIKDVAEALDIHPFMLSKWRKQVRDGVLRARVAVDPEARRETESIEMKALSKLRREHALLKEEHELLKKAIRFCSDPRNKSLRS